MSAYYILTPFGQHPCSSRPLLDSDSKGWRTVKRCMTTCRRKRCRDCERGVSRIYRIRSDEELEAISTSDAHDTTVIDAEYDKEEKFLLSSDSSSESSENSM